MPKRKSKSDAVSVNELMAELERVTEAVRRGEVGEEEFAHWWWQHFGIKGKGILTSFLKQRELARGWGNKRKSQKSS